VPDLAFERAVATMDPASSLPVRAATRDLARETTMLWAILVILVVLWALGLVASIAGPLIHLLLVLAVIVLAVQLLQGRRTL
jgi:hypothetical protein